MSSVINENIKVLNLSSFDLIVLQYLNKLQDIDTITRLHRRSCQKENRGENENSIR